MDAAPPVRGERVVVRGLDMTQSRNDEQGKHQQLDDDEDVIRARALTDAQQQEPGDQTDDQKCRQVDENRNAGEVWRGVEEAMDLGIGAEQRRAISGRQPVRKMNAKVADERLEVVSPGNGHRDVADRVLENQIPSDDPGDYLAECRVRIRVRATRLRYHRRELGVAQAGECAADAQQPEGEHEGRSGACAHHGACRIVLSRGRRSDRAEDPGADHGADRQHDEIAGPEDASERLRCLELADQELRDGLALEELPHETPGVRYESWCYG